MSSLRIALVFLASASCAGEVSPFYGSGFDSGSTVPDGPTVPDVVPSSRADVALGRVDAGQDALPDVASVPDVLRSPSAPDAGDAGDAGDDPDAGDAGDASDAGRLSFCPQCFGSYDVLLQPGPGAQWFGQDAGGAETGGPCTGFGCWYACNDAGPCLGSSTCPTGLACVVTLATAVGNNPDSAQGTCMVPR